MKVPIKWLSEFVDLNRSVEELAHLITMAGLEVDAIEKVADFGALVVSACVDTRVPHPNADRLSLCEIDDGDTVRTVVCGAKNMKAGDIVVLAKPGAVLPGGMKISRSKIRGVRSEGMLCSARELGLGDTHDGIWVLPEGTEIGKPFFEVFSGADTVLDISITPNRSDCLSIVGVARDVAALTGRMWSTPPVSLGTPESGPVSASLTSLSPSCPFYLGRVLTGVHVGPSPDWLAQRLRAVDSRPINNIVDATNYILLERGQPVHAFDLDRLTGQHIVVRQAQTGEKLLCLDGVERSLQEQDLAICDEEGVVAIAGVMGGEASAVHPGTQRILIEVAWFEPLAVRATSKRLGLHTDASHRFERGVDPGSLMDVMDAVTALIQKVAGGIVQGDLLTAGHPPLKQQLIRMRPWRVNGLLGMRLHHDRMAHHLRSLGMDVRIVHDSGASPPSEQPSVGSGDPILHVTPPTWRLDITQEADLAEEIARMEGYERVGTTLPTSTLNVPSIATGRARVRDLVDFLAACGLSQALNYSFVGASFLEQFQFSKDDPRARPIGLLNPISEDMGVLRTALLPGLVRNVAYNAHRQTLDVQLFEVGRIFLPVDACPRPEEYHHLAVAVSGVRQARHWAASAPTPVDLYDVKGVLEALIRHLRLDGLEFEEKQADPYLAPGQGWVVKVRNTVVGAIGMLHPDVGRALELEQTTYVMELNLEPLWAQVSAPQHFETLPKYPSVERDLAIMVDTNCPVGELLNAIQTRAGKRLERVQLFDVYRGKGIPIGKKSVAFNLIFRAKDRTLVDAEVQNSYDRIVRTLSELFGAERR